jgi:hypothetical protein
MALTRYVASPPQAAAGGITLVARDYHRHFNVSGTASRLQLFNVTLRGFGTPSNPSGGVYVRNNGRVEANNVTFVDNRSNIGGAVRVQGSTLVCT